MAEPTSSEVLGTIRVDSPAGAFRGLLSGATTAVFAGIPFAAPPIGELRLQPPRPPTCTSGEHDATRFAPAPAQGIPALGGGAATPTLTTLRAMFTSPSAVSEDCLYLNVWTPDVSGQRPVIVWICGGGFEAGSGSPPVTDGATLSRLTDTVVVAFNYRVGALGFGYWAGAGGSAWAKSSNLGLQDQIAALQWVKANIAAFGGDPANITVAGQSAGAFCIGSLLAIESARGLFAKAMLLSGSTRRVFSVSTADAVAHALFERLELETPEQLRDVGVAAIVAAQTAVIDSDIGRRNLPGGRSWGVILDGTVLRQDPHAAIVAGVAREVPLLIGASRDEIELFRLMQGASFIPSTDAEFEAELAKAGVVDPGAALAGYRERTVQGDAGGDLGAPRSAFLADAIYRRPASAMASAQAGAGGRAWTYLFSATPVGSQAGAFHGADLLYGFDLLAGRDSKPSDYEQIQGQLVAAWKAFAHNGDPGWPAYDPDQPNNTRQFGGDPFVTEPPADAASAAWRDSGVLSSRAR